MLESDSLPNDDERTAEQERLANGRSFPSINRAYNRVFVPNRLSVGLVVPLEAYPAGPVPRMERHVERARLAEKLGFTALWLRDVPFHVPAFGDAGQLFDPFPYLGFLAASTSRIGLGVASVVLPLRHPAHVAKAAASVDVLSGGRMLLGVASGDRPQEYPRSTFPSRNAAKDFARATRTFAAWQSMRLRFKTSLARRPTGWIFCLSQRDKDYRC